MVAKPLGLADLANKHHVRNLFETIVHPSVCSGCAACVLSCPVDALDYAVDRPVLLDTCIDCVLCSNACPRLEFSGDDVRGLAFGVSLPPEDVIGSYRQIVAARATSQPIHQAGQDGGAVTAILRWAFHKGLIEGAVVSRRSPGERWQPYPFLAEQAIDLASTAGSAYTYSPNLLALKDAAKRNLTKLAVVGTGCEISGLRQLQVAKSKKLRAIGLRAVLAIGLLCSETFDYIPFIEEQIEGNLGVDLREVVKINIKGKVLVYLRSGEIVNIPLKLVRPCARHACHFCQDFGAEYADLSAGGLGLDGWTIVTVRTEVGEQYLRGAAEDGFIELHGTDDFSQALELYRRLSEKQRQRPLRPVAEV